MKSGIGFPSYIPGVDPSLLPKWATAADAGPFSSLSLIDRIVFPNHDPLISLTWAAAMTSRVNLITTVLLASLWEPARLAKQAATLDVLSNGRFILGVSSGGSPGDYAVTGYPFTGRGRRLDEILAFLHKAWRVEPMAEGTPPLGPAPSTPGGPPILIGAISDKGIARVGKYADGFIASGLGPQLEMAPIFAEKVQSSWREAGRSGAPMLKKAVYFSLGPRARERGSIFMQQYYGLMRGPLTAEAFIAGMLTTPEEIRQVLETYEAAGYDEVCLWPTVAEFDQLERLAEIVR